MKVIVASRVPLLLPPVSRFASEFLVWFGSSALNQSSLLASSNTRQTIFERFVTVRAENRNLLSLEILLFDQKGIQ